MGTKAKRAPQRIIAERRSNITGKPIAKSKPESAECFYHRQDIVAHILNLFAPSGGHTFIAERERVRLWLWALYRRGRLDHMNETGSDDTPGSRGTKDEEGA